MVKSEKKKELIRSIKFLLFSISAGIIDFGSFSLMKMLLPIGSVNAFVTSVGSVFKASPDQLFQVISVTLSVIWNFTLNRHYTFKSASNVPVAMLKVAAYYLLFFLPFTRWDVGYFVDTLGVNSFLVKAVNMLINFSTEFLYQRFFVFRKSLDTNSLAQKEREAEASAAEETISE